MKPGIAPLVLVIVIGIVLAAGGLGLAWKMGWIGKPEKEQPPPATQGGEPETKLTLSIKNVEKLPVLNLGNWSPDSTELIYIRNKDESCETLECPVVYGIYDIKSGGAAEIAGFETGVFPGASFKWFSDGKSLGIYDAPAPYIYRMDNKSLEKIPGLNVGRFDFDFSPDGTKLVYIEQDGSIKIRDLKTNETWTMGVKKSDSYPYPLWGFPSWSPDGKYIAFLDRFVADPIIYKEASEARVLVLESGAQDLGGVRELGRTFEADAEAFFIFRWSSDSRFLLAGYSNSIFSIEGETILQGRVDEWSYRRLAFSPNLEKLLIRDYIRQQQEDPYDIFFESVLSVSDLDGTNKKELFRRDDSAYEGPEFAFDATWHPNRDYLIYNFGTNLFAIKSDGSGYKRLNDDPLSCNVLGVSPSGEYLLCGYYQEVQLITFDVE